MKRHGIFQKRGFESSRKVKGRRTVPGCVVFFLVAGCLLLCSGAFAVETTLEASAGYDDNPAEIDGAEGSGLARYYLQVALPVLKKSTGARGDLFLDVLYSQYFSLGDDYRLRAGGAYFAPLWIERIRVGFFAEGSMYRDELVADDERNSVLAGGDLQWLVDARLSLSLEEIFSRVEFQNKVSIPGQRTYSSGNGRGRGAGGSGTISGTEVTRYSRNDTVWTTEMTATYAVSPDVQVDLSCLYRSSDSSDDFESFRETGGSGNISWYFSESMEFYLSGYWSRLDYETSPESSDRSDDFYGYGLGASRRVGAVKLFATLDRTENDSPISGETYKKSVILCGVSCTF